MRYPWCWISRDFEAVDATDGCVDDHLSWRGRHVIRREVRELVSENQGCLGAIFRMFGGRPSAETALKSTDELPYRLRDDFLSPGELAFYRVLVASVDGTATVLTKVNLSDLFFVSQPRESAKHWNRINRKHVDFLLCDVTTMRPLVGIELDDRSHEAAKRQERDRFVERVFETAGLPLVRVPLRSGYSVNELRSVLAPHVRVDHEATAGGADAVDREVVTPNATGQAPTCPKCGVPMVERTASRGERRGERFYGCPNYPRCRETVAFE